jgi:hypothetical protein
VKDFETDQLEQGENGKGRRDLEIASQISTVANDPHSQFTALKEN